MHFSAFTCILLRSIQKNCSTFVDCTGTDWCELGPLEYMENCACVFDTD